MHQCRCGRGARRAPSRRQLLRAGAGAAIVGSVALLAGCGFALRGSSNLPFATLYVQGPENSAFVTDLKREVLATTSTRLVNDPKHAQAVFDLLSESQTQVPMAYNADGTVALYQLRYSIRYALRTPGGQSIFPPRELTQTSNLSYSSGATLAKANESDLLYRGMRRDLVNRVMFQLAAARLP